MRTLANFAFTIGAAALFAGCGGSQSPIGTPGAVPQSRTIAQHVDRRGSWMLPEAKGEDLLYVANLNAGNVTVYDYQKHNSVGTLDTVPSLGECVDRSGNVYITGNSGVTEYAHGGTKPIQTFSDPGYKPYACTVDYKSRHVAVANFRYEGSNSGNITVYAPGSIKTYSIGTISHYWACGYDTNGNLLVGGWPDSSGNGVAFAMLPKGGSNLVSISLGASSQRWPSISAIQWDGKYWAVTIPAYSTKNETVYRYSIESSKATFEGRTTLYSANGQFGQTWIVNLSRNVHRQGTQIVAAEGALDEVQYFKYPEGKKAKDSMSDSGYPAGVTLSLAPR